MLVKQGDLRETRKRAEADRMYLLLCKNFLYLSSRLRVVVATLRFFPETFPKPLDFNRALALR